MKRIFLFLSLLFFVQIASGQEVVVDKILKKNIFSISYLPPIIEGFKSDLIAASKGHRDPVIIEGEYGYAAVGYNNPGYSGVVMLSYSRRLTPKFEMTLGLGYEQVWKDWKLYNNPAQITKKIEHNHYLYCMLNASLIHVSKERVEIYSSIGLGAQTVWDNVAQIDARIESINNTKLAAQVCLIGIRARYDWWGFFCNLEVGHLGLFRLGLFAGW